MKRIFIICIGWLAAAATAPANIIWSGSMYQRTYVVVVGAVSGCRDGVGEGRSVLIGAGDARVRLDVAERVVGHNGAGSSVYGKLAVEVVGGIRCWIEADTPLFKLR